MCPCGYNSFPWGKVARRKLFSALTDGGALIGWAGGQPYLASPFKGGVTVGDGEVLLPLGEVSCVSKTERVMRTAAYTKSCKAEDGFM